MATCAVCGGRLTDDLAWCPLCYTPIARAIEGAEWRPQEPLLYSRPLPHAWADPPVDRPADPPEPTEPTPAEDAPQDEEGEGAPEPELPSPPGRLWPIESLPQDEHTTPYQPLGWIESSTVRRHLELVRPLEDDEEDEREAQDEGVEVATGGETSSPAVALVESEAAPPAPPEPFTELQAEVRAREPGPLILPPPEGRLVVLPEAEGEVDEQPDEFPARAGRLRGLAAVLGRLFVTVLVLGVGVAAWAVAQGYVDEMGRVAEAWRLFFVAAYGLVALVVLWTTWRPRRIVLPESETILAVDPEEPAPADRFGPRP